MEAAAFWLAILGGLAFLAIWYARMPPEKKEELRQQTQKNAELRGAIGSRKKITEVGMRGEGGLGVACPRCGGTQFVPKRSISGKLAVGILAPKTQVKCVACGAMFKRG